MSDTDSVVSTNSGEHHSNEGDDTVHVELDIEVVPEVMEQFEEALDAMIDEDGEASEGDDSQTHIDRLLKSYRRGLL